MMKCDFFRCRICIFGVFMLPFLAKFDVLLHAFCRTGLFVNAQPYTECAVINVFAHLSNNF